ncbi:MAG: hypothetical protein K2N87_10890 [Eubacterium sp.]|nr:hypothetical protein [Eubacterium sp.]
MGGIFRESAMERLSSPDRLDCMIKVTTPLSWVGISVAGILSILLILWSFAGSIPEAVSVNGFLIGSYNTNTVFSSAAGRVTENFVKEGERVLPGMPLLALRDVTGRDITVFSNQPGIISSVLATENEMVITNQELFRLSPDTRNALSILCYVGLDIAKQLQPGMEVRIYFSRSDLQDFEYARAEITNIDSYVSSKEAVSGLLGDAMADALTANGLQAAVTCELKEDLKADRDGFYFLRDQNRKIFVSGGEQVCVQVILSECAPIQKVFPFLGES